MSFYNLSTELENVGEQTTMSSISFLPVHLGNTIKAISGLSKKKKKWQIEILEDEDGRIVVFEDELKIHVPHMHWKSFVTIFDRDITSGDELNLNTILKEEKRILREQLEKDISDLKGELSNVIDGIITEAPIRKIIEHHSIWYTMFGVKTYKTPNKVLIKSETKTKDLRKLTRRLWDAYGDDKGYLELLIDAVENKQALGSYEVFKEHTFLYGTRIQSRYNGVTLVFEASVDLSFVEAETIYVDDTGVLDELEEDVGGIKVVKNLVFPVGPMFRPSVFMKLKSIIRGYEEKEETEQDKDKLTTVSNTRELNKNER